MHAEQDNTSLVAVTQQHATYSTEKYFQATKFYRGLLSPKIWRYLAQTHSIPLTISSSSFGTPEFTST